MARPILPPSRIFCERSSVPKAGKLSKPNPTFTPRSFSDVAEFKAWFEAHVSLNGKPYTLDDDQARAVLDSHKNTLVTARAGSGKTRVIVAKVAYLVANHLAKFSEIAVFMFNRTAAAEVNERISAVEIDNVSLRDINFGREIKVASTFHKYALDLVKLSGEHPQIISDSEHASLIQESFTKILDSGSYKLSSSERSEFYNLVSAFIARAGQKYPGAFYANQLRTDVNNHIAALKSDPIKNHHIKLHRIALATYLDYLARLLPPKLDFNLLMAHAANLLHEANPEICHKVSRLKYIMVDEYQDFSFLFFNMIQAMRSVCPAAKLFCVGDDWQAINRFAGSDVNYFIDFHKYFPEDYINIPLVTNYRSDRRIVKNANRYMLKNYDKKATAAIPFSKKRGKIKSINPAKVKFDPQDLYEDALGDARFQRILASTCGGDPAKYKDVAKLFKTVYKLIKRHRHREILLLHRHNFTSFAGVDLDGFYLALRNICINESIMKPDDFDVRVRIMTMHKSKGLESEVVVLLEASRDQILSSHPHAEIFTIFGDSRISEKADQHRLLYVALTRAKHKLYILSTDKKTPLLP